jgi:predicted RNA binding protein YcfA (HicA-like mRNA interferase family)
MKAAQMLRYLRSLGYLVSSQRGSHKKMRASQRPDILFSYHDGATVPPSVVKKILLTDVGLSEAEAMKLLGMKG